MKTVIFLSMPKRCTGIPVQKITLSHAHKSMISDVFRHKLIFSVVMSSPGGSCMSHQVETIQERNAYDVSRAAVFSREIKNNSNWCT